MRLATPYVERKPVPDFLNESSAGNREVAHMIFGGSRSSGPEIMWYQRPKQVVEVREKKREAAD